VPTFAGEPVTGPLPTANGIGGMPSGRDRITVPRHPSRLPGHAPSASASAPLSLSRESDGRRRHRYRHREAGESGALPRGL